MATPAPNVRKATSTKSAAAQKAAPQQNRRQSVSTTTPTNAAQAAAAPIKSAMATLIAQAKAVDSFPIGEADSEVMNFAESLIKMNGDTPVDGPIMNLPKGDATNTLITNLRQYGNSRVAGDGPRKLKTRTSEKAGQVYFQFLKDRPTSRGDGKNS